MRRIALFSDIHANAVALDAVLADIDAVGIAQRYCLGDLIGYGPDPLGVIDRLRTTCIPTIQGNYDEGVASRRGSCGCYYATDQARADGERSYAFTDTELDEGSSAWLLSLPLEIRLEEGGARILLTHGSPRKINEYLLLDRTEGQLARLAEEAGADLVCHGHIHIPYHRSFEVAQAIGGGAGDGDAGGGGGASTSGAGGRSTTVHYLSSGSVGKPKDGDPRAKWVELMLGSAEEVRAEPGHDAGAGPVGRTDVWAAMRVHRVDYDVDSVAAAMLERGLPATLVDALRAG